jgi:hypothetical protein
MCSVMIYTPAKIHLRFSVLKKKTTICHNFVVYMLEKLRPILITVAFSCANDVAFFGLPNFVRVIIIPLLKSSLQRKKPNWSIRTRYLSLPLKTPDKSMLYVSCHFSVASEKSEILLELNNIDYWCCNPVYSNTPMRNQWYPIDGSRLRLHNRNREQTSRYLMCFSARQSAIPVYSPWLLNVRDVLLLRTWSCTEIDSRPSHSHANLQLH